MTAADLKHKLEFKFLFYFIFGGDGGWLVEEPFCSNNEYVQIV